MVVINQIHLKNNNKLRLELTKLSGIGSWKANRICEDLGFNPNLRINQLNFQQTDLLVTYIQNQNYTGLELKNLIIKDIKRLINISCYKGRRHFEKLPVRGQRTRTNAKTAKKNLLPYSVNRVKKTN